ncbi:MAG: hypothetical protein PWP24_1621 [Clostridiales bacterium]|nr:hypothetical protein [Clostridiales bacterium]
MARQKSIASIEADINKTKTELNKVQEKYDRLSSELQKLQKQRRDQETRLLLDAYGKSGKSFHELMIFLGV